MMTPEAMWAKRILTKKMRDLCNIMNRRYFVGKGRIKTLIADQPKYMAYSEVERAQFPLLFEFYDAYNARVRLKKGEPFRAVFPERTIK